MSWKYVLVGLALVLLGNLLIVEGRQSQELRGARDESGLSSLLDYFRRLDREPYDVPDMGYDKNSNTDTNRVEDVENSDSAIVQDSSNNNNPQPPPSAATGDGQGWADSRAVPKNQEIGAQVEEPKALALAHTDASSSSGTKSSSAVSSLTFILIVTGCTFLAAIGVVGAGVCWYKYHKRVKSASTVDYPAYGVTGPTKDHLPSPGDRKLAQSAQMYHYQHQKQQMIAMEKANGSMKHDASDEESEEDNVEGDYTVYECPGLAPTGEMEVKNPLFRGDETPSTPVSEEPPQPQDK